ncbi:MAG: hypothetical protein QOG20_151 [Pseudonocardiales bacterium]|jgi:hypothetical protein|nr:hypothetical protein [Pseudonocardiales bacterium]
MITTCARSAPGPAGPATCGDLRTAVAGRPPAPARPRGDRPSRERPDRGHHLWTGGARSGRPRPHPVITATAPPVRRALEPHRPSPAREPPGPPPSPIASRHAPHHESTRPGTRVGEPRPTGRHAPARDPGTPRPTDHPSRRPHGSSWRLARHLVSRRAGVGHPRAVGARPAGTMHHSGPVVSGHGPSLPPVSPGFTRQGDHDRVTGERTALWQPVAFGAARSGRG